MIMCFADLGDAVKQVKALQLLLLLIPPANRHLLQQLLELLNEIANTKENKMSACSLALVFAPSVIQYKHVSKITQSYDREGWLAKVLYKDSQMD